MIPLCPNGRAVDVVRSCYETKMRFWQDSPRSVKVRWYFVPPGTPTLGFPSVFGSLNWENEETPRDSPGEVLGAPRPWSNGEYCGPLSAGIPFGSRDAWMGGATENDPVTDCSCDCCFEHDLPAVAGLESEIEFERGGRLLPAVAGLESEIEFGPDRPRPAIWLFFSNTYEYSRPFDPDDLYPVLPALAGLVAEVEFTSAGRELPALAGLVVDVEFGSAGRELPALAGLVAEVEFTSAGRELPALAGLVSEIEFTSVFTVEPTMPALAGLVVETEFFDPVKVEPTLPALAGLVVETEFFDPIKVEPTMPALAGLVVETEFFDPLKVEPTMPAGAGLVVETEFGP